MPRKGKKCQAANERWRKLVLSDCGTSAEKVDSHGPVRGREVNLSERSYADNSVQQVGHSDVTCVQASRSQTSLRYGEFSRNKQCTCNSLTFLAFLEENREITSADLDLVLDKGDDMYTRVRIEKKISHMYLASDELPDRVTARRQEYNVEKLLSRYGEFTAPVPEEADDYLNLGERLQCLTSDVNNALLIMGELCIAVFRDKAGRFGFFDPHPRSPDGLPMSHDMQSAGTATMLTFTHLSDMIRRLVQCRNMFETHSKCPYELTPVLFSSDDMPNMDDSIHTDATAATVVSPISEQEVRINYNVTQAEHDMSGPSNITSLTYDASHRMPTSNLSTPLMPSAFTDSSGNENITQVISSNFRMEPLGSEMSNLSTQYIPDVSKQSKKEQKKSKRRALCLEKNRATAKDHDDRKLEKAKQKRDVQKMKKKEKYANDKAYREQKKSNQMTRYSKDADYRGKKKSYITSRYRKDADYRGKQKSYITSRYRKDADFQFRQKSYLTDRYANEPAFRLRQKQHMKNRYRNDTVFRMHHRQHCASNLHKRYHSEAAFRMLHNMRCAMKIKRKYKSMNMQQTCTLTPQTDNPLIEKAIAVFKEEIKHGPTFVCTVCNKASFPNQVRSCIRANYIKNPYVVAACLTGSYVHVCNDECGGAQKCVVPSERKKEWICFTCHDHLKAGSMPSLAVANKLELAPIPAELCDLNILERHVIARHIPFAKIITLPKGQQRAIHGAVICVPSEVETTVNTLPRPESESQLMKVKLKRRLKYTGHYQFQTLNMRKVLTALSKLKEIHSEYKDITIREEASCSHHTIDSIAQEQMDLDDSEVTEAPESVVEQQQNSDIPQPDVSDAVDNFDLRDLMEMDSWEERGSVELNRSDQPTTEMLPSAENVTADDETHDSEQEVDEQTTGVALDTCLQPADIAHEMLTYSDSVYCIAPAEGNRPVSFFKVPKLEAMAFPVQFPTGKNTLDEANRTRMLSPSGYFKARLFCVDNRFAMDTNYIFFAQFVTEMHMATSSMSIQLRKGKPTTRDGRRISTTLLQDKREVQRLVENKDATRFMAPLRGTPAYWEKTLKDLFSMLRQLGTPTFFLTFSAAEMRWPEVITAIKAQQGQQVDFSQLDWATKCEILRSNPVTCMRMFEKRVDALMRDLLMSPAQPIGEVIDFFIRVEYQARGSPHIHLLVWCQNTPVFEEDPDQKVCDFVDKYITCKLPDQNRDPELNKMVTEVQTHSKNHSKSCKKGNKHCRFGFPKPPVNETMVTRPMPPHVSEDNEQPVLTPDRAKAKLKPVWDLLNDPKATFENTPQLLAQCNLSYEEYVDNVESLTNASVIVMKREPKECWVNGYNPHLLRAWNANMDIQFILNPYCCIMYMLSYISKAEHEMSDYLKTITKDTSQATTSDREQMKQIMQAYSKNREVSAQEAVARTCSLKLKSCSRSVVYIPTDDDALRMSLPVKYLENKAPDSEDVWMSGLPDKYKARPHTPEFQTMCMADFASNYRVVYGRQTNSKNVIRLNEDKGFIQKRSRGKPAIIRYPRFSPQKNSEKFYGTLLKLYLPYRSDAQLKCHGFQSYESFYAGASVQLPGTQFTEQVSVIVNRNRSEYDKHNTAVEKAIEVFEKQGPIEDAWTTLAPEAELDRLECISEREEVNPDEHNEQDDVPEYTASREERGGNAPIIEGPQISPAVVRKMYQSLNQTQASIFYTVRDWCMKRVHGETPGQFFYFVTGGAGTGKSHLIKCIYTEATKILCKLPRVCEESDMSMPTVLLSAFTGTAAFNISGKTLHSILKLPRSLKPPYQGLGNTLDEVRATLSNAEILVIDEVSMVSKPIFAYVNWRLQQIKGSNKPFGGMSILAVGDFYQLPPLGNAKPLCVFEEHVLDFWQDHFQMITLTEIMRQREDRAFAELLNRIRVKHKKEALSEADRSLLGQAVSDPASLPIEVLHIFATNKEVDKHNTNTMSVLHSDFVNVDADDYKKDPRTGRMERVSVPFQGRKGELADSLQVAEGARVMLTKNIDVEDGLVNGSFGNVASIVTRVQDGRTVVHMLGVQLDNVSAGQRHRNKIPDGPDNVVYIERVEEPLRRKGVVRRQFPMKLAFACTTHKVQGMTTVSAVVSLKRVFEPGMAYVALSRTTSLQGLHITDFDEKKIYANPEITTSLRDMRKDTLDNAMPLFKYAQTVSMTPTLTVIHHNTEGLSSHMDDIKTHHELCLADVLCFTETHLSGSLAADNLQLEGYSMFKRNRHVSYTNNLQLAQKSGGGVAIYVRNNLQVRPMQYFQNVTDLEFFVAKVEAPVNALIVAIYRPPLYNLTQFLPNLRSLMDSLDILDHHPIIICGDFNEDLMPNNKSKPIFALLQSRGYTQLIRTSTTEKNTLLDHIYISRPQHCLQAGVLQTYYSYHNPVYCVLTSNVS